MIILGVSHPVSWNTAACLLVNGQLVAMVEEERLNRIKHAPRMAPRLAAEYCLGTANITMRDVDAVAVGFGHPLSMVSAHLQQEGAQGAPDAMRWFARVARYGRAIPGRGVARRLMHVNHHLAHAASAFYPSDFDEANILSLDGSGGSESGILAYGRGRDITVLERISNDESWGTLYEEITGALGFKRHSGEGKTMGLAPYGTPDPNLLPFVHWNGPLPRIDVAAKRRFIARLPVRQPHEPLTQFHNDLAATLQATLERAALQMVRTLHERTGSRRLCLAGGTALNCSMNGALLLSEVVDEIFIQPAAHDAGTALGAALAVHVKLSGQRPPFHMTHAYWGPAYGNDQVLKALRAAGITTFRRSDDICRDTARALHAGKIVGWFQGRAEVGPRALGARSILANPSLPDMKDRVNIQVKRREPWRPFAPSMLHEHSAAYIEHPAPSPFMILAFQTRPEQYAALQSAIHVDHSCRPQTVSREMHPRYWAMIDAFRELSGVAAVLNTSFNIDSQPIVCAPDEAVWTFQNCGLDYMAIEDYIVWKPDTALPEELALGFHREPIENTAS